ncbi:hypothetical protein N9N28_04210 [Rubripirellula amarantea]|uniref:Transmembrane protein n=1 Tax=Rubripirellula amarantea TaxID=2527999 RepID=A0A5C5WI10_9BACT|nr:hypothetical protein [Rubripirellula amarantea]MDA8743819.1 hypothetical protein [Rubripirellula amarantea]TWT49691.1 hypothetical protein Pla22_48890 [Rubripirellula amarantea]
MSIWIDRVLTAGLLVIIALLTITAIPVIGGGHLEGRWLLAHMMASGAMVFVLPAFGITGLVRAVRSERFPKIRRAAFWIILVAGFFTIATVFLCMLPLPSTDQMHQLIFWHAFAGFVTTASAILFTLGLVMSRRTETTN